MDRGVAHVHFSSDVRNMDSWAKRTGIPLTTAEAMGTSYARAHRWLLTLKSRLVQHHGWSDTRPSDPRMLFSIERPNERRIHGGLPAGPNQCLQLPMHASSFFSPERRVQWQMVFHSDIFATQRKLCAPLEDVMNLIQCLLTGLVTLVFDEEVQGGVCQTSRGLPKADWIIANQQALVDIFGQTHFRQLFRASSDPKHSFKVEYIQASTR